jgi:putative transposase
MAEPRNITDKLRSYGAALKEVGIQDKLVTDRWVSNRAENSRKPFGRRERAIQRFRRLRSFQKLASIHAFAHNLLTSERTFSGRPVYKQAYAAALGEWRGFCFD